MIFVNWHEATAYCEWEYAARGRLTGKQYSWGDNEDQARRYANYDGTGMMVQVVKISGHGVLL